MSMHMGERSQVLEKAAVCAPGASVPDVLRLLSGGATGAILTALGDGPLRTMELTERVPGYSVRTIYRYAGKLAELDVVEREEEPGVPSKVVYRLTERCGRDLHDLVDAFAAASFTPLPDGTLDAHAWAFLGLLADLWEAGMVEALSCEARSATELAREQRGLSYHQISRRAGLFAAAGLLSESPGEGRRRRFALTEKTRRAMALVAGIGRWRHEHGGARGEGGLTRAETATVLRASLPVVSLPEHAGKCMEMSVVGKGASEAADGDVVWVEVEADGALHSCVSATPSVEGWARGEMGAWISAVLQGGTEGLVFGGDEEAVRAGLVRLHEVLWAPRSS